VCLLKNQFNTWCIIRRTPIYKNEIKIIILISSRVTGNDIGLIISQAKIIPLGITKKTFQIAFSGHRRKGKLRRRPVHDC
ncbi:hypothetical protein L9F63_017071, partial [Diploptera punctata]